MPTACASSARTPCASRIASRRFSSVRAKRSVIRSKSSPAWKRRASSTPASRTPCPASPGRRLVVDIGGGSTELIIGEGLTPLELESLQMGCVSLSERFFRDGKISAKRIERARMAARLELEPVQAAFRRRGWERCAGSSGTVRAIGEAIRELDPQPLTITPAGLERVIKYMIDVGHIRELRLAADHRRPPAGVSGRYGHPRRSVRRCWVSSEMRIADGAMREGLLYDMLGRFTDEDARERTVRAMQKRYHVDLAQAERVEATVLEFLRAGA